MTRRSTTRSLRGRLSELVPPAAIALARKLAPGRFRAPARGGVQCTGTFASYAEAARAARADGDAYDDPRIVDAVLAKTLAYRASLAARPLAMTSAIERVATTLLLAGTARPLLRVIDFGGAFGTHYWIANALVGDRVELRWHVVETGAMCARAAELATAELAFFDSLDAAVAAFGTVGAPATPDLVYCDGVLHALPDPLATLAQLIAIGAPHLCVRRVGTAERATFTVLGLRLAEHEPDVPLPASIPDGPSPIPLALVTRDAIEQTIRTRYDLTHRFGGPSQIYRFEPLTMTMVGYFGELRAPATAPAPASSASSGHSRQ